MTERYIESKWFQDREIAETNLNEIAGFTAAVLIGFRYGFNTAGYLLCTSSGSPGSPFPNTAEEYGPSPTLRCSTSLAGRSRFKGPRALPREICPVG
jgi:hypothetical protein